MTLPNDTQRVIEIDEREGGILVLRSTLPMGPVERSVCVYLEHWANDRPDQIFLASRGPGGDWETIDYRLMWNRVRCVAQAFLDRGLSKGDRIAILSGNSIEHAIVTFAGMSAGLVVSPISPNYSLLPGGAARLQEIAKVLKPAIVFAQNDGKHVVARTIPELASAQWLSAVGSSDAPALSDLYSTKPASGFQAAYAALAPKDPAKILFTSGSTGSPKGVINTHLMMASSVAMGTNLFPAPMPPVQLDWLPWHHTMGGNATLHGVLKNGGTLYIDDGRPTRELFGRTLANLRGLSPTSMLNAPLGYEMLVDALAADAPLRATFFKNLQRLSYGGAAIPRGTLERLQAMAVEACGRQVPVMSAYGATETAPGICTTYWPSKQSGEIGLPFPGLELKLVPTTDCYEVRVRGPNVMPGYLERPDETAAAFDAEGFYCVGDTVTFLDSADPSKGLRFRGRLSESFKLTNGTWVVAGELRLKLLNATKGVFQDLVVAGENRDRVAIMGWLNLEASRAHIGNPANLVSITAATKDSQLRQAIVRMLQEHNKTASGSERISTFALLVEPPSLAAGETTDKAYINQRAVLNNRADVVDDLYAVAPSGAVLVGY